jgi:predicted aconitase
MHLSREEELIYQGRRGESLRRAMEILVALGDIFDADRLIPVKSVQIAGVSFKNIGKAGLEWISDLKGKVVVPSILNPAGMDLYRWQEMGIDENFALKQKATIDAYSRLGISIDCTCTPYQINPQIACPGDHLAWSESSAVSFANSVIGARTNREGGPSALAAALIGKTPFYGYHLNQNRIPTHRIDVEADLKGSDFGALGFLVGRTVKDGVPLFKLPNRPTLDELKSLGAAMAASGSVALYYVGGVTPTPPEESGKPEKISVDRKQIDEVYERHPGMDVDIVALGCPHCSKAELKRIAELLEGKEVKKDLWVCTARKIAEGCPDLVARIEKSGAKVICDTCMVVSPASEKFRKMMVNSGKALAYIPGLCGIEAGFGSTEECIEVATRRD